MNAIVLKFQIFLFWIWIFAQKDDNKRKNCSYKHLPSHPITDLEIIFFSVVLFLSHSFCTLFWLEKIRNEIRWFIYNMPTLLLMDLFIFPLNKKCFWFSVSLFFLFVQLTFSSAVRIKNALGSVACMTSCLYSINVISFVSFFVCSPRQSLTRKEQEIVIQDMKKAGHYSRWAFMHACINVYNRM